MKQFHEIFTNKKPIIGMIHLRPLPGSPLYDPTVMNMKKIIAVAIEEAKILQEAGVDGLQVENMWDIPYLKGNQISHETTAALAIGVNEVVNHVNIPVGAECHMNGAESALACAVAANAEWVRVFEWCNAFISQAGYIEAVGGKLSRMRSNLRAENDVCFLCDVNVKHGSHFIIHDRSVEEQAMDVEAQNGDAIIVTGFDTGTPPTVERVQSCKKAVKLPILLGSGVNTSNAKELLSHADGAIVGSWFKENNNWKNKVSFDRIREFMKEVESLRGELG